MYLEISFEVFWIFVLTVFLICISLSVLVMTFAIWWKIVKSPEPEQKQETQRFEKAKKAFKKAMKKDEQQEQKQPEKKPLDKSKKPKDEKKKDKPVWQREKTRL